MPKRILHVVSDLRHSGASKQLTLLSRGLAPDAFAVEVCVLGNDVPCAQPLVQAGIPVHVLGRTNRLDLVSLWNLRRLLHAFRPDVVHTWDSAAWRCLSLAIAPSSCPVVAGNALGSVRTRLKLPLVERWLLGRAACIVARGQAEATRCREAGLPAGRISVVPPAVDNASWSDIVGRIGNPSYGVPASSRLILCAGPLEPEHGYRDAIWSLEILLFLFDDLHLLLAGAGPERVRLERFAVRNRLNHRVHFLGPRADVAALLDRAEIVWIPHLADGGVHSALEGLAAGKPVIASNLPSLREIITDAESGFLITPGDKVALARRTAELLRNPDLARRLGDAGRRRAQTFSPGELVNRFARLYAELAA